MSNPDPKRVKAIFGEALDLPPDARAAFLAVECGADAALRARVERLLASAGDAGAFLASPTRTSPTGGPLEGAGELPPGTMLGTRYRIVELAGAGGMGEVYRAEDLELGQTVALKLLPARVGHDEAALSRLRREVRIARQVSHPNVCRVYDIGEADGRWFLTMEWIDGRTLASVLRDDGKLPTDRAASIGRQVSAGLAAAHERGVIHRDLKPANVMLEASGVARITDFGLAEIAAVESGEKAREGTPQYMSPEQLAGREVGPASDIYSLGLVLYELFTGRPAYDGASLEALTRRRQEEPAAPSRLSPEIGHHVEKLILRCLAEDPGRRPANARDLAAVLPHGGPVDAALSFAQERADRIAAFRAELDELRRAGMMSVADEELRRVEAHHDRVLRDLVENFDVDTSERGKQLSLGMRAVSFVGALALAASVYYFFYRIWGALSTGVQVGILAAAPVATLGLTAAIARRDRQGYFTMITALATLACFIVNVALLGATFNMTSSPLSLFAWGLFALFLAFGYRLRLLLVVGLALLSAFVAATILHASGGFWPGFPLRPEGFLPCGVVLLLLAWRERLRPGSRFAPVYGVMGVVFLVAPSVLAGVAGSLSYLPWPERTVEIVHQAFGFAVSAAILWLGIARRFKGAVYTGTLFLVLLLYVEFVDWWWDWMPRYLFFLLVALVSVGVLFGLRRLRRTLATPAVEAAP